MVPRTQTNVPVKRQKCARTIRPISGSAINNLGQVLTKEKWLFMDPILKPTQLTELFEFYTQETINIFCPQKQVFARPNDLPYVTETMKILKRKIQREYEKRRKSIKYFELKALWETLLQKEIKKYKQKLSDDLRSGNRNSVYSAIRKLGARPGEQVPRTFTLPSHADRNLSAQESAEILADHFAIISQEYDPVNIERFPPRLKVKLLNPDLQNIPKLEEYEVFRRLRRSKKPNSVVPGDLPKKIIQEFSCEISAPVTVIYNSILSYLEYPRQWVVEQQIVLPKVSPPSCEDDLRNISKTAFLSKVFESFLADWLIPIVEPFLDPCQFGLKGSSISHYLLQLLKFIHSNLDLKNPHAVVVAMVDLSKAFNRVSLQMVIEDLNDMHVPAWLLLILISYMTNRSMVLTFNGAKAKARALPGSSPQGAFLGIFCFIVKYNGASLRPKIPRLLFLKACSEKRANCKTTSCPTHKKDTHAIYIDDLSEAEAINLKKQLILDPSSRPLPLNFHERTGHIFPTDNSLLQKQLTKIEEFTHKNQMKINSSKSKIMIFNKSKKYDFPPEFSFQNGENLDVVNETKLLGLIISSDLRWYSNTKAIYNKAMSKMWLIRRMMVLKLEPELIFYYYIKEIRVLAEQGVAIWNSGLTRSQITELEKIQKVALKIILGDLYSSYKTACHFFKIDTLSKRRLHLCTQFAIKLYRSDKSYNFFKHSTKLTKTRAEQPLLVENLCNTTRAFNAPHNYLTRLVNQNQSKIKQNGK